MSAEPVAAPAEIRPAMTSAQLLLAWDSKRTAERKPGLSMSALGGCRKRAGYLDANTPPSNPSGSVQSAMGSAAHEKIAEAASELFPDDLVEVAVEFAGLPGTLDRYDAAEQTLIDTKTTSSRWLEHIKQHGIGDDWRYQTAGYAAALIQQGRSVKWIRIDVLARDTGEEWTTTRLFDPAEVREAMGWVMKVRSTPLDMLPRDYLPDSPFCRGCPFFDLCWEGHDEGRTPLTVLYREDPDAAKWAAELWQARQDIKEAKDREARAKGALEAVRPDLDETCVLDVGWRLPIKWTVSKVRRLDTEAVKAEYKLTGATPPMTESTQTKVAFVEGQDS